MSYLPLKLAGFLAWAQSFAATVAANKVALGVTDPESTEITNRVTAFADAYAVAQNPATRTGPTVAAQAQARAAAEELIRPTATAISANPNITNELKAECGVTIRKTVPTPIPAPVAAPALAVRSLSANGITVSVAQAGNIGSNAKPFGCIGVEVYVTTGQAPAVDPDSARYVGTFGKPLVIIPTNAQDKGKTITMWGRYITRSGPAGQAQRGPWSVAATAIAQ